MTFAAPAAPARREPPGTADERSTAEAFLDRQRTTFARKLAGLDTEQLRRRSVEPSSLSLLGLARHLAEVERSRWREGVAGEDAPARTYSPDNPDGDVDVTGTADVAADLAWLAQEQAHARRILAARSLDDTWQHPAAGPSPSGGC